MTDAQRLELLTESLLFEFFNSKDSVNFAKAVSEEFRSAWKNLQRDTVYRIAEENRGIKKYFALFSFVLYNAQKRPYFDRLVKNAISEADKYLDGEIDLAERMEILSSQKRLPMAISLIVADVFMDGGY